MQGSTALKVLVFYCAHNISMGGIVKQETVLVMLLKHQDDALLFLEFCIDGEDLIRIIDDRFECQGNVPSCGCLFRDIWGIKIVAHPQSNRCNDILHKRFV